jgi:hypothetical protein
MPDERDLAPELAIVLVAIVALLYVWVGAAAHGLDQVSGLGVAWPSWPRSRLPADLGRRAIALLVVGALPVGIVTWWSIATPVLAVLAFLLGRSAIRYTNQPRRFATW